MGNTATRSKRSVSPSSPSEAGREAADSLQPSMCRMPVAEHLKQIGKHGLKAGRFVRVPLTGFPVLQSTSSAFVLYVRLLSYIPFNNSSSKVYPSISHLAEKQ